MWNIWGKADSSEGVEWSVYADYLIFPSLTVLLDTVKMFESWIPEKSESQATHAGTSAYSQAIPHFPHIFESGIANKVDV